LKGLVERVGGVHQWWRRVVKVGGVVVNILGIQGGRQTGDGQEKRVRDAVQRQSYVQIGGVSLLMGMGRWWSPIPWSGRKIDAMKRERKYR